MQILPTDQFARDLKRLGKKYPSITCVQLIDEEIHLLTMYDKSEIENVNDEFLNELAEAIKQR